MKDIRGIVCIEKMDLFDSRVKWRLWWLLADGYGCWN